MIAYITGIIYAKEESAVIVLVQGIGYRIFLPQRLLDNCSVGAAVEMHVRHHIREDAQELYGFLERDDLWVFEKLLQTSGVGPRIALAILSQYSANDIRHAII